MFCRPVIVSGSPPDFQLSGSPAAARMREQIRSWVPGPELSFTRSGTGRGRLGTALREAARDLKDSQHHQNMAGEPGKKGHWGHAVREASWRRQQAQEVEKGVTGKKMLAIWRACCLCVRTPERSHRPHHSCPQACRDAGPWLAMCDHRGLPPQQARKLAAWGGRWWGRAGGFCCAILWPRVH